jgi:Protein kinase domain
MNTNLEKIDQIFHQALECTKENRAEFLARACQDDRALQDEVQSLIDSHEENENFMEMPVMKTSLSPQFNSWQEHILDRLSAGIGPESVDSDLGQTGGKVLNGKYRIEELRGQGGMGAVYRATHLGTGRTVAVKILAPDLAGESNFVERFRREAKTVGLLHHPNIVNIMDFGLTSATSQTVAYLVMEYLEGRTLWVSEK